LEALPQPVLSPHPSRQRRLRAIVLVAAVLAVLAFAGGGVLLSRGSSKVQAAPASGAGVGSRPPAVPPSAELSAPPQVQRVDHAQPIAWRDAGQLVINYYNGLENLTSAWLMLSPAAQAPFGTMSDFKSYWAQYSSVSARNAFGVTNNPDGSVRVPVDVTYNKDSSTQVVKRVLRVIRLDGQLLIDSDPR
jgi:hypothetical protein